jgi:UDP-N-acetylglucosamine 2-epimerase (non-hydrolysing)
MHAFSADTGAEYYENLSADSYLYLVKNAAVLIGNSSSGIIEAPSLHTPTVNIGHRQDGRVRAQSVFDTECTENGIEAAIRCALAADLTTCVNPYDQPDTAKRYFQTTLALLERQEKAPKTFYDLELPEK